MKALTMQKLIGIAILIATVIIVAVTSDDYDRIKQDRINYELAKLKRMCYNK